jgi:alpha-glucosidase
MWEWNESRKQFYLHQFVAGQPDLNYENRAVINEMLAATKFWLEMGVDGFRFDAVPHMFEVPELTDEPENPDRPSDALPDEYRYWSHPYTYDLPAVRDTLAQFRQIIDIYSALDGKDRCSEIINNFLIQKYCITQRYHVLLNIFRCLMVEATIPTLEGLFEYYGNDSHPIAHFPFNFEFINRIKPGFNGTDIIGVVDEWFAKMPPGKTANWLVGNHDNHRVSARFGDWVVDILNMIIHLLPGSSVTYYGEEIGMQDTFISWEDTVDPAGCQAGPDRYEQFTRDPERTPMQWDDSKNGGA